MSDPGDTRNPELGSLDTLAGGPLASPVYYDEAGQPYDPGTFADLQNRTSTGVTFGDFPNVIRQAMERAKLAAAVDKLKAQVDQGAAEWPRLGPGASTGAIMDYVATYYPGYIGFFNAVPEIRSLLVQAAQEGWTPQLLEARVQGTGWFRSTAQPARDFALLETQDPATAQTMIATTAAELRNKAQALGLGFSGRQLAQMAAQVLRNGWSNSQTIDALLSGLNWTTVQPGTLTATVDEVRDIAGEYLVGVSDSTARNYSARIASGELTIEGVRSIMRKQARDRFGWMSSEIDQGVTPLNMLQPARDIIASTLEMSPESIDMMDPKWLSLVEVRDPDTGERRSATMNEAMLAARQRPEFAETSAAEELSANMANVVLQAMGI